MLVPFGRQVVPLENAESLTQTIFFNGPIGDHPNLGDHLDP